MEFHLVLPHAAIHVDGIDRAITALDPAAVVDLAPDGATVRMATSLDLARIRDALAAAGVSVAARQVVQLPSVCCGSCSG